MSLTDRSSDWIAGMYDEFYSLYPEPEPPRRSFPRLLRTARILLSAVFLFVTGFFALPEAPVHGNSLNLLSPTAPVADELVLTSTSSPTPQPDHPVTPTLDPVKSFQLLVTPTPEPVESFQLPLAPTSSLPSPLTQGLLFLSISEGGNSHLFAYQPLSLPFTRLTDGAWDDITPALSPDGKTLAFASNRGGAWDLYRLDLASGEITRLTDTAAYDTSPSWSPDGQYLVYESYQAGGASLAENLEVLLTPVFDYGDPIPLSDGRCLRYSARPRRWPGCIGA